MTVTDDGLLQSPDGWRLFNSSPLHWTNSAIGLPNRRPVIRFLRTLFGDGHDSNRRKWMSS